MSYYVKGWEAESLIKEILAKHEGFVSPECSIEVSFPFSLTVTFFSIYNDIFFFFVGN